MKSAGSSTKSDVAFLFPRPRFLAIPATSQQTATAGAFTFCRREAGFILLYFSFGKDASSPFPSYNLAGPLFWSSFYTASPTAASFCFFCFDFVFRLHALPSPASRYTFLSRNFSSSHRHLTTRPPEVSCPYTLHRKSGSLELLRKQSADQNTLLTGYYR